MNSYLRTPKLTKFNALINILNQKRGRLRRSINKYPAQKQDLSKDA